MTPDEFKLTVDEIANAPMGTDLKILNVLLLVATLLNESLNRSSSLVPPRSIGPDEPAISPKP